MGADTEGENQPGQGSRGPGDLRAVACHEQEDSGLLQTLVMRSQADPTEVFVVVVFESEEKARAREEDPRRQEGLQRIRGAMGNVLDGQPEFFDCNVLLNG